jgi:hypothetical protein
LPLTEKVRFKTSLQKGNRIQIPRKIRWLYKMDSDQVFIVSVDALNVYTSSWQTFYATMTKDGRITIPKLQRQLLLNDERTRHIMDVTLEPA